MKRAVILSVVGHLAAIGGVMAVAHEQPRLLPGKVYTYTTVDLVAAPGGPRSGAGGAARKAPPVETSKLKARSGIKVDSAPSSEKSAPRGVKKPKAAIEKPATPAKGGGSGIGKEGSGGLRIDGEAFPYQGYLDTLTALIKEKWDQRMIADAGQALKATVFFSLDRDGTVLECRVEAPSGTFEFDDAARKAVFQASPVNPLPSGFKGTGLGVHLDFYGE
ncbi:MAG: TonB family protein [Candidatus Latescibacterota bacterium]|jgi:TonB family protein